MLPLSRLAYEHMLTSMTPNRKVHMLPLALSTVLTTPITAPTAMMSCLNIWTPGSRSSKKFTTETAITIPTSMKMLK